MKRKISVTLDPWGAAWLDAAVELLTAPGQLLQDERPSAKRQIIRCAIVAVCREIVLEGNAPARPWAMAVTLRPETDEERHGRVNETMPAAPAESEPGEPDNIIPINRLRFLDN